MATEDDDRGETSHDHVWGERESATIKIEHGQIERWRTSSIEGDRTREESKSSVVSLGASAQGPARTGFSGCVSDGIAEPRL